MRKMMPIGTKKLPKKNFNGRMIPYLLILPTVFLILVFTFYPITYVFNLSTQNYTSYRIFEKGFIGLENFKLIFSGDEAFYRSLVVTAKWVISEVGLQLVIGFFVALLLNRRFSARGAVRAIIFVPWAVSGVLTTMLWILIYNQHFGLINLVFSQLNLITEGIAWLSNMDLVFPSIVVAELWRGIPFFAITLLAGLQSIPGEIYESASIDGCGPIKKVTFITIPFLRETIVFSTLLRFIWEFNSIDMIFTLTGGGPHDLTTTLPIYMMKTSLIQGNYGYGAALSVVIFMILAFFAVLYLKANQFGRGIND